jgi:ketosteroid isomerase-like protein
MFTGDDFHRSREQVEAAVSSFVTGDPAPYQACWSHADDVTIFGAWGAYDQGWEQVGPRLEWAGARFRGGQIAFEPLAMGMSGDLAYTIGIERGEARVAGCDEVSLMALRVTHLYRREDDTWKLIHRHADAIIAKTEASAVLQR